MKSSKFTSNSKSIPASPQLQKQPSVSASLTVKVSSSVSGYRCVYLISPTNSVEIFQYLYLLVQAIQKQAALSPEQFAQEMKSAPFTAGSGSTLPGLPPNYLCKKLLLKAQKFELQYIFLSETEFLYWVK
jgi:hypothetical protein